MINQNNLILLAVWEYLRHKYEVSIFFSARISDPPMLVGPPSISIAIDIPIGGGDRGLWASGFYRIVALRLNDGIIHVYRNWGHHTFKPVTSVDINDPQLFDIIEEYCANPTIVDKEK